MLKIEGKTRKSLGYKMVEVVKSYEMVRTFNNFKASVTFAMKKSEALLILVEKFRIFLY